MSADPGWTPGEKAAYAAGARAAHAAIVQTLADLDHRVQIGATPPPTWATFLPALREAAEAVQ